MNYEDIYIGVIEWRDISAVRLNDSNPRTIKDPKFEKLVISLKQFPQMLGFRPVLIDEDDVALGGNMRYRAAREAGMTKIPVIVCRGLTDEQKLELIIKDNVGFGDWDFEALANDWSDLPLEDWGLDIPKVDLDDAPQQSAKEKKFKLEVMADSEDEQNDIFEKLQAAGYDVKKK